MEKVQHPQIIPTFVPIFPITEENIKKYLYKMPRLNIEMVFFGSDPWSIYVLKSLEDNFDVKAVVTAPNSAVANYFKGQVLTPDILDSNFLASHFSSLTSDLFVVASYGKIIPKFILDIPKNGALNIHPSLLPKYRGPSPIQEAILKGDRISGITIIKMDEEVDHGPIIYQEKMELSDNDNYDTLSKKMFRRASEILPQVIEDFIQGKIKPHGQNNAMALFCPKLSRESGYFNINNPPSPEILDRIIRAYYPWPGAWTYWEVQSAKGKVKRVIKLLPNGLIQMEGKKVMPLRDFLNGYPDFPLKEL